MNRIQHLVLRPAYSTCRVPTSLPPRTRLFHRSALDVGGVKSTMLRSPLLTCRLPSCLYSFEACAFLVYRRRLAGVSWGLDALVFWESECYSRMLVLCAPPPLVCFGDALPWRAVAPAGLTRSWVAGTRALGCE